MSNFNNTKEIFTIPEIAQMTGMSIARVRTLIKSGNINGNLNINAVNEKNRKVKRMEVTKRDLVEFAIKNPDLAGPLMYEEFVQEEIAALTHDPVEVSNVNEEKPAEEVSADEHTEQPAAPDTSSTELTRAIDDIFTPEPYSELDVDNAGAFEETVSADTESCNLIRSVIEEHINILTANRAGLEAKKREIERIIEEIGHKLENATKALNQIRECAVNREE